MRTNQRIMGIAAVTTLMVGTLGINILRAEAANSMWMHHQGLLADNDACH